jgi:hypothetical protein
MISIKNSLACDTQHIPISTGTPDILTKVLRSTRDHAIVSSTHNLSNALKSQNILSFDAIEPQIFHTALNQDTKQVIKKWLAMLH